LLDKSEYIFSACALSDFRKQNNPAKKARNVFRFMGWENETN